MKISVVIPCYNEALNIPLILKRFERIIQEKDIEVILINNGSTDGSEEIIEKLLPRYRFAKTVSVPVNQGYGYGIIQGLKRADGDYIGWTHADMQTDPKDIVKAYNIIEKYKNEKLFIKGTRKGRPFFDEIFTRSMSAFETIYFRTLLLDINAQPNLFPKDFFKTWINPPYDFSLDLYALYTAKIKKLRIIRFAVQFPERIHGKSKWDDGLKSKIKFIKRTLKFSYELKHQS